MQWWLKLHIPKLAEIQETQAAEVASGVLEGLPLQKRDGLYLHRASGRLYAPSAIRTELIATAHVRGGQQGIG